MKRLLTLVLLALLLCGCATQPQSEATTFPPETTAAPTEPTEPTGSYVPASELEAQTNGAVRSYLPDIPDCYGMLTMGHDVLVFSGIDTTTLTRLSGDNLFTVASAQLGCMVYPEDTSFQISSNGITYYNYATREVIFLDNDLKEVSRLGMSASMVGKPVMSSNRLKVYYCTADAVRVYDLETGLDKLLKSISYPEQSMEDILLNDTVLRCSLIDSQGLEYSVFLSADTGELLDEVQYGLQLTTGDDRYYAIVNEGTMNVLIFGSADGEVESLIPADAFADPWFLEDEHAAVTLTASEASSILDYYDLNTGLRTASVELPGGLYPWYMEEDRDNGYVYLLGYDQLNGQVTLCRWKLDATPTGDGTDYTGLRYTLENPDEAGLAECADYAAAIGEKHGMEILIGTAALEHQPWDYELEAEYHVPVIRRQLQNLEQYLAAFPEGFFESIYGGKRICIVRSITGSAESGSLDSAAGLQYWQGDTAYVALAAEESLGYSFYHEMFHIIDSKVLSNSRVYYYWHNLNPEDFDYYEDYSSYMTEDNSRYLQDETRAFVDAYSMSYAKEDRARVMEYACNPGNEHYFQSEIMQEKLKTLCEGIRDAFRLKQYPNEFLWEQYLNEPLTP